MRTRSQARAADAKSNPPPEPANGATHANGVPAPTPALVSTVVAGKDPVLEMRLVAAACVDRRARSELTRHIRAHHLGHRDTMAAWRIVERLQQLGVDYDEGALAGLGDGQAARLVADAVHSSPMPPTREALDQMVALFFADRGKRLLAEPTTAFVDALKDPGDTIDALSKSYVQMGELLARMRGGGGPPRSLSLAEVAAQWEQSGELVHEPTGIPSLDAATGGGPCYGTRWIVQGAPDAGKTALVCAHLALTYARRSILVGILSPDEEEDDTTTRVAQNCGFSRDDCEKRDPQVLAAMQKKIGELPIALYGERFTIEQAAEDVAEKAREQGRRACLLVDSLQTARSAASSSLEDGRDAGPRMVVYENALALKRVAARHKLIAWGTSEMNRNAYRSKSSAEENNDMSAGAESRGIEYRAKVLLSLRSVKGERDLIELKIVKNKHGPAHGDEEAIYLRIDRARMHLEEAPAPSVEDKAFADAKRNLVEVEQDALSVLAIVAAHPGIGSRALAAQVRASGGKMGVGRLDGALARLLDSGRVVDRSTTRGKVTDHRYFPTDVSARVRDVSETSEVKS
jgi:KaiC/GvpD/RAD55 family RecA-like ATPase